MATPTGAARARHPPPHDVSDRHQICVVNAEAETLLRPLLRVRQGAKAAAAAASLDLAAQGPEVYVRPA